MIVPYEKLNPDTLVNLIEHYILREGTDYGEEEFSKENKVAQIQAQLKSGDALVVFSELHESVNIISKVEFQAMQSDECF